MTELTTTREIEKQCAVFTIATGDERYLKMAYALARSFRLWNSPTELPFILVTDRVTKRLPEDLDWICVSQIEPGAFGKGFTPKLHLDQLAPARRSLFIDADCLCVGDLTPVFEKFAGHPVSVIGRMISEGEWFGDVAQICARLGVHRMPRFNGGIYYLEKGKTTDYTFGTARELEKKYDEIGFLRLRGVPNDEVLISAGMAINGQNPIPEDGKIMNSLLAAPGGIEVDVFKGRAVLKNPKDHPKHNNWYEFETLFPLLVHYVGCPVSASPYVDEVVRLDLVCSRHLPIWLSTMIVRACYTWPGWGKSRIKWLFRPVFRRLFGVRKVKSEGRF